MKRLVWRVSTGMCLSIVALTSVAPAAADAQGSGGQAQLWAEQVIPAADIGFSVPTDIAYQPSPRRLVVQGVGPGGKALRKLSLLGARESGRPLPADTLASSYDPKRRDVVTLRSVSARIPNEPAARVAKISGLTGRAAPKAGLDVDLDPSRVRDIAMGTDGRLYALEGSDIVLLTRGPRGLTGDTVAVVRIRGRVGTTADAVIVDPRGQRFWVLDREERTIRRLTNTGRVDRSIPLGRTGVRSPRDAVFAPSADPTDPASELSLYVADAGGRKNGRVVGAGVRELSTTAPVRMPISIASTQINHISTIDTSRWNPPSPDPMGITWTGARGEYVLVDSEVVENHPVWNGSVNGWTFQPDGAVVDRWGTWGVQGWNSEPVGLAYDNSVPRYFVSNDSKQTIHEVRSGSDGRFWTADDDRAVIDVSGYSADPEGLAFGRGMIFIADGAAKEVYVIDSLDGDFFNSVSVSNFDVERFGVRDAEGAAFAGDRGVNGTLFVLSRKGDVLIEVTPNGSLVATYSIKVLGANNPSGLAYGARSTDASKKSLYISARGVDNNDDPNENDGRVYEIAIPGGGPDPDPDPPPPPPTQVTLRNGSFEQDADGNGQPDIWTQNSRFTRSDDSPQLGNWVGRHFSDSDQNHNIQQDVGGIVAGQRYRLSGLVDARTGSDSYDFKVRIIWRNASNKKIADETISHFRTKPTAGWEAFSADRVAPANAAIARVVMVVRSLDGTILVDGWELAQVP